MGLEVAEVLMLFKGNASGALKSMAEVKGGMTEVGQSGNKLSGLGAIATGAAAGLLVVGAVVAGVGAISLKMSADFEHATTQLVTGAGESQAALASVRQGILDMAPEVGQTPLELAHGIFTIESAGYHGAEGLKVLRAAAEGAQIGAADMTTVADGLTTVMKNYNIPVSQAAKVTSQLVATVADGKMHMQDLNASLGAVLPTAAALNVPFTEVAGAIATMTVNGTVSEKATTSLKFLMSALAGPTAAAAKELKGLGVGEAEIPGITKSVSDELGKLGLHTSEVAAVLAKGDFRGAMKMITDAIGKEFPAGSAQYEAALKAAVGGQRGMTAALELSGVHAKEWTKNVGDISAATTEAGGHVKGWALIQQDFNVRLKQFGAAVNVAAIEIGTKLLPMAGKLLDWAGQMLPKITPVVSALADKLPGAIDAIRATLTPVVTTLGFLAQHLDVIGPLLGGLVGGFIALNVQMAIQAALAGGPGLAAFIIRLIAVTVTMGPATAATALFNLVMSANPISLIVIGIALLIAGILLLVTHWKLVTKVAQDVWSAITHFIGDAFKFVTTAIGDAIAWVGANWPLILGILSGPVGLILVLVVTHFTQIKDFITKIISEVIAWIAQEIPKLPEQIGFALGFAIVKVIQFGADIWAWATTEIPKFVGKVIGFIAELPGKAWNEFLALLGKLGDLRDRLHDWAFTEIPKFVNTIINFLAGLPGKAWDAFMAFEDKVHDWEVALITWATTAIPNFVRTVMNGLASLPGQALEIGKNIVLGIAKGIADFAGHAVGAIGDLVKGLVTGANAAGQGKSPYQLFAPVGANVDAGVGMGINKGHVALDAMKAHVGALSGVVGSSSYTMAGALGGGGGVGAGAGGQTINNYNNFNAPIDPAAGRRIGRDLAWEMKT